VLTVDYDRLGVRPGDLVLDLGCGGGRHAYEAQRRGAQVVALDTDRQELAGVREMMAAVGADGAGGGAQGSPTQPPPAGRGDAVAADGRRLPFADATFDRVIAAEVLEHVVDDRAVMAEVHRVLRPGGRAAVTVPRWWPEVVCWALSSAYHEVEGGHVRIYRRAQLDARLRAAGLTPVGRAHAHALHSPYWWLKCLVGVDRDVAPVRAYHRLLVWDLLHGPAVTRRTEALLDPVLGKSLVVYADRPATGADAPTRRVPATAAAGRP
jgi:SAM-dependent methyltransferase